VTTPEAADNLERLRRVNELAADMETAVQRSDWLAALTASVEVAAGVTATQEWLVDSARAAGLQDQEIAGALRVTPGRITQRFGKRAETARRLREQLDALLSQPSEEGDAG
jgi:hypothetical protein